MNIPTSIQPVKNFTKNLTVDCFLDPQQPDGTSSIVSTESNTPKTPKTHPFYQNLVDVLKMEKEFEDLSMKAKQNSVPVRKLSKKVYLKSKTQVVSDVVEEDLFLLRGDKTHTNTTADMNTFFELAPEELAKAKQGESQSAGAFTRQTLKAKTGVINRFSLREEDTQDITPKKKGLGEHPFRHLIFNTNASLPQKEFLKHLISIQRGLIYAEKHIKRPSDNKVLPKTVPLDPLPHGMKTLVLDLDGTLVHALDRKDETQTQGHVTLKMKDDDEKIRTFGVHFRPYLHYFLEKISPYFEIVVFTSALPNYASAIVDYIDPQKKIIKYVMCRDRCLVTKNGVYIKDLRVLGNRDLQDVLIVDNLTHNFCLQVDNGVPILDYQDDPDDRELKYLADYLVKCAEAENMVEFNSKFLRLRELLDFELLPKERKREEN